MVPSSVIPAVSQAADLTFLPVEADFEVNRGRVKVDPATYATNARGVYGGRAARSWQTSIRS